jgi:hypothetical protein
MYRFYLKKLNDADVTKRTVQVKDPSKKLAVSKNLDNYVDIITAWKNNEENITILAN